MLWQLYIENVAIIEKLSLEFSSGFLVFTGETGAGKSILIDSIGAALGERVSRELVRRGAARASVTATFTDITPAVRAKLRELGYESEEDTLLLTREVTADGRSTCRIDGKPATVATVRAVAPMLLQIHGQHDTQSLLSPEAQGEILDRYARLTGEVAAYREGYRRLLALGRELDKLSMDEAAKERAVDLLTYQIDEIERAGLNPDEEEELAARRALGRNSAKIVGALSDARVYLEGAEDAPGSLELLSSAASELRAIAKFSDEIGALSGQLEDAYYTLEEAARTLREMGESYDCDPSELESIESRLDVIYRLGRKYGQGVETILAFQADAQKKLDALESNDARREELAREIEALRKKLESEAALLHGRRAEAAERMTERVRENLAFLDMPNVRFLCAFETVPLGENGVDRSGFLISTNPGEEPKPIARIASGGELSRIMLALKNVQADSDEVGTFIFDEIDTGVSGRAAQKIGQKLVATAEDRQVICVTHLAQIAVMANEHFLLYKTVEGDRTYTRARLLDREARVGELSRIMGGVNITELVRENADEMLRLAGN